MAILGLLIDTILINFIFYYFNGYLNFFNYLIPYFNYLIVRIIFSKNGLKMDS